MKLSLTVLLLSAATLTLAARPLSSEARRTTIVSISTITVTAHPASSTSTLGVSTSSAIIHSVSGSSIRISTSTESSHCQPTRGIFFKFRGRHALHPLCRVP
ncbi:hypothetical protein FB45DRAFT_875847 [Roridomyces roridus]|uniref:Uncharacterized protein n=1 Tax=Roridomyces roridus TaxID=1738132 RepID=A0AAD7B5F9_9AGAR|nr:hypothetical protein FB45DRAFT_875847 [Roridomyces roridus]